MSFKQLSILLSVSTVVVMNVVTTKALSQEEPSIKFDKAIAAPGCVIADQLVGEDGRTLSILFDDFEAKDGKRKPCNIRANITIPSDYYVKDLQFLYQGTTEVPSGTRGTSLSRSYIFNGGGLGIIKAPPTISKFTSTNELFQEQDVVTVASASCGGQGQLGINIIAQSSPGTSITLGSPDFIGQEVEIYLALAPC